MLKTIYIIPVGTIRKEIVEFVKQETGKIFDVPFKILSGIKLPPSAFNPQRKQYYSAEILKQIKKNLPEDGLKIIGITEVDLATPVLTFVFGEAQLGGQTALISTHRLSPQYYNLPANDKLLFERVVKEAVHELGHTFNLIHCPNPECVMYLSNSIRNIDHKKRTFCPACSESLIHELRKLHSLE